MCIRFSSYLTQPSYFIEILLIKTLESYFLLDLSNLTKYPVQDDLSLVCNMTE